MQEERNTAGKGGPASVIHLPETPVMEREMSIGPPRAAALHCWDPRPGEIFTLVGPRGTFYRGRLIGFNGETATVVPFHRFDGPVESPVDIRLFQALPEKERFELILQKATELGAYGITPFQSRRSTTLAAREKGQRKSHRWPHILLRAARQCRRAMIPELSPPLSWEEMLKIAGQADLTLLLYEREGSRTLGEALAGFRGKSLSIIVGPEGGLIRPEADAVLRAGGQAVSLGNRILRTETAAITALGLAQHLVGDLGG